METYIVRQPILNDKQTVVAYELLYKENCINATPDRQEAWVASAVEELLGKANDENFLDDKIAFVTFTPNLLMKNIPRMFPEKSLVIQIGDDSIVHPVAQKMIYRFKKQGYRIALKDFEFMPRFFGIMDAVDILKVDFRKPESSLRNIVNVAHSFDKEVAAYHLDTQEALDLARELKCQYYQGSVVAKREKSRIHRVDHMQSNFFQLMIAVTRDEPDIDEIAKIISRDVTLAFSLMKLVNSAYFALRNQVKSVQQALVILGLGQLKQWIYLLSFREENAGLQEELIKTSFLRANFCMELAKLVPDLPIAPPEAYLMGMFSTLGSLMDIPLELALDELPVSEEIKKALTTGEGSCGNLYKLVLCYENADWDGMVQLAQALSIPESRLTQIYFECVEYVNAIWKQLHMPMTRLKEEEAKAENEAEEPVLS